MISLEEFNYQFDEILSTLTYQEVIAIRKNIDDFVDAKKDAAKVSLANRLAEARKELEAKFDAEAKEIGVDLLAENKARQKAPPVYQNLDDPSQTWSGRGKRPQWFTKNLANGVTDESMRIPTATGTPTDTPTDTPF